MRRHFKTLPEPFAKGDTAFLSRWHRLRFEQLLREDVRKDTAIRELDQMESLARILAVRSGEQLVWSSLGAEVQVSEITAKAWTAVLESFFFGFRVKPWVRDIAGAIRKTPKWYLRDWSRIRDDGKRHETMFSIPCEDIDCFALDGPYSVPARTFLSQLP